MDQEDEQQEGLSTWGRAAVAGALVGVLVLAGLLFLGGDTYEVRARFQAATQMVPGNQVKIAGRPAGLVEEIELTEDNEAELVLKIDEEFAPLREGTEATIRIASLSGVVNRYVDLRIPSADTTSAVDIDQLFALFDDDTKKGLTDVIRGSAKLYEGRG